MAGEVFVLALLALLTIIGSVVLWNVFATARTKIDATPIETTRELAAGSDRGYRRLAEHAVDAEERTAESLAELAR
ncbi:hypothetical protein ER308_04385 [Egibacter rhizosphaerae]|uniref:Uncharacterized protein n=1 Tax=Egibacter rhizosphaerae TaxID=1670831 RepID=A0A411YCB2_9ACTN|nr:hypothetical protein [Egibacter rhizosphaerae]QBI18854.1 hypothetical protein ER308_04385 [Egibacter rhizosphaerae]